MHQYLTPEQMAQSLYFQYLYQGALSAGTLLAKGLVVISILYLLVSVIVAGLKKNQIRHEQRVSLRQKGDNL